LWAALLVDEWRSRRRSASVDTRRLVGFVRLTAALGLIGVVYQAFMLRAYPILQDRRLVDNTSTPWLDRDHRLGKRTFALRSIYNSLGTDLPPDAIVQYNSDATSFIPNQLYSGHDAAVGLPQCGAAFGGDVLRCAGRAKSIGALFGKPSQSDSAGLDAVCREYGISVMLVDDLDPAWKTHESWVWTRKPILANDHVRAFACGDPSEQAQIAGVQQGVPLAKQ
jgi:hypothetical protein